VTEKQIETQILVWLNYQPRIFAFKVNTVGVYDEKRKLFRRNMNPYIIRGTSDILGVIDSRFFCLEVKTPAELKRIRKKNDVTPQSMFIDKVKSRGGYGAFVSSLEEARAFIKMLMNENERLPDCQP
jgi:hypothetical protein